MTLHSLYLYRLSFHCFYHQGVHVPKDVNQGNYEKKIAKLLLVDMKREPSSRENPKQSILGFKDNEKV